MFKPFLQGYDMFWCPEHVALNIHKTSRVSTSQYSINKNNIEQLFHHGRDQCWKKRMSYMSSHRLQLQQLPSLHLFLFLSLLQVDGWPWLPTAACPPAEASRAFPGRPKGSPPFEHGNGFSCSGYHAWLSINMCIYMCIHIYMILYVYIFISIDYIRLLYDITVLLFQRPKWSILVNVIQKKNRAGDLFVLRHFME